jgi:hypothetical protein
MSLPEPIVERIKIRDLVKLKMTVPDCQREKEWDDDMYNAAIDSIVNNIDIGQIIVSYSTQLDSYEILDGQHRYEAINKYYLSNNNIVFNNKLVTVCKYINLTKVQQNKLYIRINTGLEQNLDHMDKVNDTKNIKEFINSFSEKINNEDKLNLIVNTVLYIVQDYYNNGEANITVKNLTKKNHFLKNLNKINEKYEDDDTKNIITVTDYILKQILDKNMHIYECINKVKKIKNIILTSILYHIMHEFFNKIKERNFKFELIYDRFYAYAWKYLYKEKKTKVKDNFTIVQKLYSDYVIGTLIINDNITLDEDDDVNNNIIMSSDED